MSGPREVAGQPMTLPESASPVFRARGHRHGEREARRRRILPDSRGRADLAELILKYGRLVGTTARVRGHPARQARRHAAPAAPARNGHAVTDGRVDALNDIGNAERFYAELGAIPCLRSGNRHLAPMGRFRWKDDNDEALRAAAFIARSWFEDLARESDPAGKRSSWRTRSGPAARTAYTT